MEENLRYVAAEVIAEPVPYAHCLKALANKCAEFICRMRYILTCGTQEQAS